MPEISVCGGVASKQHFVRSTVACLKQQPQPHDVLDDGSLTLVAIAAIAWHRHSKSLPALPGGQAGKSLQGAALRSPLIGR